MVVVEVVGGREGDDPETDDEGADREDPVAGLPVLGSEG